MAGALRIDERLNLVAPIDRPDGSVVWLHAQPISVQAYDRYWFVLAKVFASIYGEGLNTIAGPKIAHRLLRRLANEEDADDDKKPDGVFNGLMPEIRRMARVVAPTAQTGWDIIPFEEAAKKGIISEEDADEIEGLLVFFTVAWHLHKRGKERQAVMDLVARRLDASMSSQSLSAFANSLRTSSATGNTGATRPIPSLPPSLTGEPVSDSTHASTTETPISPGHQPTNFASVI